MNWKTGLAVAVAAVLIGLLVVLTGPRRASLLLINGTIYRADGTPYTVEAVAIRNGTIAALGTTREVTRRYDADRVVDLKGRPVYPGFIDAHGHVESLGASLLNLDLAGTSSIGEIRSRLAAWKTTLKPGQWIRGRGWDQNDWPEKRFPHHRDIDEVAGDIPVVLTRIDGHAVWVNQRVLEIAGITGETPDPEGGLIVRNPDGTPAGVFVDAAADLLQSVLPHPSEEDRAEAVRRSLAMCASLGLAEVHDMGVDSAGVELYRRLAASRELPIRVYAVLEGSDTALVRASFSRGPEVDLYDGMLTIRAVKMYADGALGSYGAALLEPYSDNPGTRGLTLTSSASLVDLCSRALDHGFQVCTHAIGDRANTIVLDAYEAAQTGAAGAARADARFRIEHAQVIAPADIPRFKKLGVLPSMQPTHCTSDMPWAGARLGEARLRGAYAWRSLLEAGSIIPGGSDFPVEHPNPLLGFYAAITRQDLNGQPPDGWQPDQRMSRMEALMSFTGWAAYAAFQGRSRGSLEEGKRADLVVLSDDIMTIDAGRIPRVRVDFTIVNGAIRSERTVPDTANQHQSPS
jgi:predicted amidohydrolase YtcJ